MSSERPRKGGSGGGSASGGARRGAGSAAGKGGGKAAGKAGAEGRKRRPRGGAKAAGASKGGGARAADAAKGGGAAKAAQGSKRGGSPKAAGSAKPGASQKAGAGKKKAASRSKPGAQRQKGSATRKKRGAARKGGSGRRGGSEREFSAGGVVVNRGKVVTIVPTRRAADGSRVLALPKGHVDPGETPIQAAAREVREETGVVGEPVRELGETRYWYRRDGLTIGKSVSFFLFTYVEGDIADHDDEVEEVRWLSFKEAQKQLSHAAEREMVALAQDYLHKDR